MWCTHKPYDNLGANYTSRIKIWLKYQKGLSPFVSNGPLHLKHVIATQWHIHIESLIFFMDRYINKVLLFALHVKFEQVLIFLPSPRKKSKTLFLEKKNSNIHKECLNNFFWPKILTTNNLGTNVYKMYECDITQALLQCKKWISFMEIYKLASVYTFQKLQVLEV